MNSLIDKIIRIDESYLTIINTLKHSMFTITSIIKESNDNKDKKEDDNIYMLQELLENKATLAIPPINHRKDYIIQINGIDHLTRDNLYRNIVKMLENLNGYRINSSSELKITYPLELRFFDDISKHHKKLLNILIYLIYKNMLDNASKYSGHHLIINPEDQFDILFYLSLQYDLIYEKDYSTNPLGFPYNIVFRKDNPIYDDSEPKLVLDVESRTHNGLPVKLLFEHLLDKYLEDSVKSNEVLQNLFGGFIKEYYIKDPMCCDSANLLEIIENIKGNERLHYILSRLFENINNQEAIIRILRGLCDSINKDSLYCIDSIRLAAQSLWLSNEEEKSESLAKWINSNYLLLPLLIISMLNGFLLLPNVVPRIINGNETKCETETEHDAIILGVGPRLNNDTDNVLRSFIGVFEISSSKDVDSKLNGLIEKLDKCWNKSLYNGMPYIDFLCFIIYPKVFEDFRNNNRNDLDCFNGLSICEYRYGSQDENMVKLFIMSADNIFNLRIFRYSIWFMLCSVYGDCSRIGSSNSFNTVDMSKITEVIEG